MAGSNEFPGSKADPHVENLNSTACGGRRFALFRIATVQPAVETFPAPGAGLAVAGASPCARHPAGDAVRLPPRLHRHPGRAAGSLPRSRRAPARDRIGLRRRYSPPGRLPPVPRRDPAPRRPARSGSARVPALPMATSSTCRACCPALARTAPGTCSPSGTAGAAP